MDSRKHLANASLGKKSGLPLPQELGQPPPLVSATTAWGQPGAQSGGQQVLQTQDWVSGTPELALQVGWSQRAVEEAPQASRRAESHLMGGTRCPLGGHHTVCFCWACRRGLPQSAPASHPGPRGRPPDSHPVSRQAGRQSAEFVPKL